MIHSPSNNLSGNKSNPALNALGKDDKNHTLVFKFSDFSEHPDIGLTRGGLILIGLLSGGDYHTGLARCGMKTAVGLAKCGFGDALLQAVTTLSQDRLSDFLNSWRTEVRLEIQTNARGLIGRKSPALAKCLRNDFPDIDVVMSYVNPVTSATMGKPYRPGDIRWDREPDISKIAGICESFFEWGYKESIIKRFRTVIWHSAVLRILRRAVLNIETGNKIKPSSKPQIFNTPSKSGRRLDPSTCGTPSKMIAKYFSHLGIGERGDDDDDEGDPLIVKIHSSRKHAYTDGILEYRLEISPAQLVHLVELGIKGTREKPVDEWEDEEEKQDKEAKEEAAKDPLDHMRMWMPACMVEIVEPTLVEAFNEVEAKKAAKKANKGQGRGRKKAEEGTDGDDTATSPTKSKKAPVPKKKAPAKVSDDEEDVLPTSPPRRKATTNSRPPAATSKSKASTSTSTSAKSKARVVGSMRLTAPGLSSDDDNSDAEPPSPSRLFASGLRQPSRNSALPTRSDRALDAFDSGSEIAPSPPSTRRTGVKDLTGRNNSSRLTSVSTTGGSTITGFFPASKPSARNISAATEKPRESTRATKPNALAGPSKKAPLAPVQLKFFDDYDLSVKGGANESFNSDDLFSRTPSPQKPGTSKLAHEINFEDDELPVLFPALPTAHKVKEGPTASSVGLSPSKSRSHRQRTLSISDSDSDSRDRYKKSPRKSASHNAPASSKAPRRTASPTPQPRNGSKSVPVPGLSKKPASKTGMNLAMIKKKIDLKSLPVYEVSSDEDGDDADDSEVEEITVASARSLATAESSKSWTKAGESGSSNIRSDVPPLMRARENIPRKGLASSERIFIDLT
jgi:Holliday junction resolvase YEN1